MQRWSSKTVLPFPRLHYYIKGTSTKTFVKLSALWLLKGGGWGFQWISVKEGKFVTKIFLADNFEWSSKNLWKMMSADVTTSIKQQEINDLVAHLTNFYARRLTFKTWNTMQIAGVFFIWSWLVFYPFWYTPVKKGGGLTFS